MTKEMLYELIKNSFEDQLQREKRLNNHVTSYLTASSIVLISETTLFIQLQKSYLNISIAYWIGALAILILQLLVVAINYIVLFPGLRASTGCPNDIYKWFMDFSNDENELTDDSFSKMFSEFYNKKYEYARNDINKKYKRLKVLAVISFVLVLLFSKVTICCCIYSSLNVWNILFYEK